MQILIPKKVKCKADNSRRGIRGLVLIILCVFSSLYVDAFGSKKLHINYLEDSGLA